MTNDIANTTMLSPSDAAFVKDPNQPVLANGRFMLADASIKPHTHPRGQLLWAEKGVLRVSGDEAVWVVPSSHAMWIPSNKPHQASSETDTVTRNIYIDPSFTVRKHEKRIVMVTMTALMREIILRLTSSDHNLNDAQQQRLGLVALDELETLEPFEHFLQSSNDPRLQRLINYVVQHPNHQQALPELAKISGASVRTIERLFKSETGMTYRQWRSRFRLMNSLEQLNQGSSSTEVAHALGYKSASSFISAFKTQFGCTPQTYRMRP